MNDATTAARRARVATVGILLTALPFLASAAVPDIPRETKTFDQIVLDVKSQLNRKLDELRRTYGIREVNAGGFHFIDRRDNVVMTIETNRVLSADRTERLEEFIYRNRDRRLLLHERVLTRGLDLEFHDFESRLFQAGSEHYDLEDANQSRKEATLRMGMGSLFRVVTTRTEADDVDVKRHLVSVGERGEFEIVDTMYKDRDYRTYDYRTFENQVMILSFGSPTFQFSNWLGTYRVAVRTSPRLLRPEVTYEAFSSSRYSVLNGLDSFSRRLHRHVILPFIESGVVQAIKQSSERPHLWPETQSMQSIGADSKFLNELIVIRSELSQAKTNPAVLSLVETKVNVFIKDIQEGALKVNDFR